MRPTIVASLALLLASCDAGTVTVLVNLRTDLVPGLEVGSATTEVASAPDASPLSSRVRGLDASMDLVAGARVAELQAPRGQVYLTVRLADPTGTELVARTLAAQVNGPRAFTVLITRSCRGVRCPDASNPTATECLGGRCVSPECTLETPEACPDPSCRGSADCPTGPPCTAPVCLEGECGLSADTRACGAGEVCSPDDGCVARASADAGPARSDAGPGADAGRTDAGPGADGGPAPSCAAVCPGTCTDGTCVITGPTSATCPDGVPCRIACDAPDSCSGPLICGTGPCAIDCLGTDSCAGAIDCSRASSCVVECPGPGSCADVTCGGATCDLRCGPDTCTNVTCGPGANSIDCPGTDSCANLSCQGAGSVAVQCTAPGSCAGSVVCGGSLCEVDCGFSDCPSIDCSGACACDVNCPSSSCTSPAKCPPGCQSGRGCTPPASGCSC